MLNTAATVVRRLITTTALVALIPVTAALLSTAAIVSCPFSVRRGGRWRLVRLASFALLYLVGDLAGVIAAGAVRLRRPPRSAADRAALRTTDYALLERLLNVLRRAAARNFGLVVRVTPAVPDLGAADAQGPVLVLARHAGPGDSFLVIHFLLSEARLRPHIVLKRMLRLDPCLDVLVSRLPHCFLPAPRGTAGPDAVAALAAGLGTGDALVIFPEGGNFTERRHRRAIAFLRRAGQSRTAARAERMRHVLPPRSAGALAALAAAPTADVVFVAHTGLDAIDSVRGGWRAVPLRAPVRAHWWRVPSAAVPAGDEARAEWLLDQWARVDEWIAERDEQGPPDD